MASFRSSSSHHRLIITAAAAAAANMRRLVMSFTNNDRGRGGLSLKNGLLDSDFTFSSSRHSESKNWTACATTLFESPEYKAGGSLVVVDVAIEIVKNDDDRGDEIWNLER